MLRQSKANQGLNRNYVKLITNKEGDKSEVNSQNILAVRKAGHLNIETKIFDFEARVLNGWLLANTLRVFANSERVS